MEKGLKTNLCKRFEFYSPFPTFLPSVQLCVKIIKFNQRKLNRKTKKKKNTKYLKRGAPATVGRVDIDEEQLFMQNVLQQP